MKEFFKKIGMRAFDSVRGELIGVVGFVGVVWLGFLLSAVSPLENWLDLEPRRLAGIPGIIGMPFLHADLEHIVANSFPLFVLLALLAGSRANSARIVAGLILVTGTLSWLALGIFSSEPTHYVGASGLVFALIGFLVAAGFLERRPIPLLISIIVGVMYGWTTITGVLPLSKTTSELAHFYGLISGVGIAYVMSLTEQGKSDGPLTKSLEDVVG